MGDFKKFGKTGGFHGGDHKGGFNRGGDRPSFGNKGSFHGRDDRDRGERPEMFSTTCAKCSKSCEVPFRPNGERPVFCKDCFVDKRAQFGGDRDHRDAPERPFQKREFTPSYSPVPRPAVADPRIEDLKRQVEVMNKKLDTLVQMIEGIAHKHSAAPVADVKKVEQTPAKTVKKVVSKKVTKAKK